MGVRVPERLRADWAALTRPTDPAGTFHPRLVEQLPDPVQRWLLHAIEPGTPLCRRAVLEQHGALRLGAWRRFAAVEALAPLEGFIWAVNAYVFGVPVRGFDRYTGGTGELRHTAFGLRVAAAEGPDVTRSAAARAASELIWVPAVALAPEVEWKPVDESRATALVPGGDRLCEVTLTVRATGELEKVTVPRWTDAGGTPWHEELFAAVCHSEGSFGGYTVPIHVSAGWGHGTPRWSTGGVFVRQVVDRIGYR